MRKLNKYHLNDYFHVNMIRKHFKTSDSAEPKEDNGDIEGMLGDSSPSQEQKSPPPKRPPPKATNDDEGGDDDEEGGIDDDDDDE